MSDRCFGKFVDRASVLLHSLSALRRHRYLGKLESIGKVDRELHSWIGDIAKVFELDDDYRDFMGRESERPSSTVV